MPPDRSEAAVEAQEELGALDITSRRWVDQLSPVSLTVVDALLEGDSASLGALREALRDALADVFHDGAHADEARGYLLALLAMTRWGTERLPDAAAAQLPRESHAWRLLQELGAEQPRSSSELKERLGTTDSQVSRSGRQLLAHGLVNQRRAGRTAIWELTPRGRQVLRDDEPRRSDAR